MKDRYLGTRIWCYQFPRNWPHGPIYGTVDNDVPSGNYKEDEGFARYLVRKKYGLNKLPKSMTVRPWKAPS